MKLKRLILTVIILVNTVSCKSTDSSRYRQTQDSAPQFEYDTIRLNNSTPRYIPYNDFKSRTYTVLGRTYVPLKTGKGYSEEGYASWYGQKFHSHLTSNGEVYDMFAMTAAHKTLPLPSFVKVTNLENGKTAIVRVNDRGPFHDDRIIDLSYAAAHKLDTLANGVAKVKLEVIHVSEDSLYTVGAGPTQTFEQYIGIASPVLPEEKTAVTNGWFIQVAALSNKDKIETLSRVLSNLYQVPSHVPEDDSLYRLQLGPIPNQHNAQQLLAELKINGYPSAYMVSPPNY